MNRTTIAGVATVVALGAAGTTALVTRTGEPPPEPDVTVTLQTSGPKVFPGETLVVEWASQGIESGSCRAEGWGVDGQWLPDSGDAQIQRVEAHVGDELHLGVSCEKPGSDERVRSSQPVAVVRKVDRGGTGVFKLGCDATGQEDHIDPIVAPGVDPFGHLHRFYGAKTVTPDSTYDSLLAAVRDDPDATTCTEFRHDSGKPARNGTSIWAPPVWLSGEKLKSSTATAGMTIYYRSDNTSTITEIFPPGFRAIAGSPVITREDAKAARDVLWFCGDQNKARVDELPPDCAGAAGIHVQIEFGTCWSGSPDSPDHRSHLRREIRSRCQGANPFRVPKIVMIFNYDVFGTLHRRIRATDTLTVGDGDMAQWQMHADYQFAWEPLRFAFLAHNCLNSEVNCKGRPPAGP